jgi:glycogen operon protein
MLLGGDELGRTQRGNNNAYCQDNETSWVDWAHADQGLVEFVRRLTTLRRSFRPLRLNRWLADDGPGEGRRDVCWLAPAGQPMTIDDWHDARRHCLGVQLACAEDPPVLLLFNAESDPVDFRLPSGTWRVELESATPCLTPAPVSGAAILVPARCVMLLVGAPSTVPTQATS